MRFLVFALAAVLLGGCNLVISPTALFTEADTVGAPVLRPGIWVFTEGACPFDAAAPPDRWPPCVKAERIDARGRLVPHEDDKAWSLRLAKGDPMILQAVDTSGGDAFFFAGVRPTRTEKDGRISALSIWFVDCGPEPPEDARNPDGSRRYVSLELGPGLSAEADGCVARDAAAVRAAARASEARQENRRYRWVREAP
jgi:hypothetical protein